MPAAAGALWALQGVDLEVRRGEVLGIVGRNGAGKSTLLQLLCGTLTPTAGEVGVRGRVAALLELGAGFNPEFTGRENAVMNATLLGLSAREVQERLPQMLAFADIGSFVDQPVKTYSSGMFVRLAFAVATSVEPDILIIDEALSVGDGAFARKSFDRIMELRRAGATILFCSHSMYQVEALCQRALWLEAGRVRALGGASEVCGAYQAELNGLSGGGSRLGGSQAFGGSWDEPVAQGAGEPAQQGGAAGLVAAAAPGTGRITGVRLRCGEASGAVVRARSGVDDVHLEVSFVCDPALPCPSVAVGFSDAQGVTVSSAISSLDGVVMTRGPQGQGRCTLTLPAVALLKGRYAITPFLLSEDALHAYDQVLHAVHLEVVQDSPLQGVVNLPHRWSVGS